MAAVDDYLNDLNRAASEEEESEEEEEDEEKVEVDARGPRRASNADASSSSSSSSSAETDDDDDDDATDDDDDDDAPTSVDNAWAWSTGGVGQTAVPRASAAAAKKKTILLPGEKRSLKKRHVAETRAARSAKKNGFTPEDVRVALERMLASGAREWRPPVNGGTCGAREARAIDALARCYPGLSTEIATTAASGRKKRASVVVRNRNVNGGEEDGEEDGERARGGGGGGGGGGGEIEDAADDDEEAEEPAPRAGPAIPPDASARAAALAAPPPTRDAFLSDPARLAKVDKALGRGRGGRGGRHHDGRARAPPPGTTGKRGEGKYNAPASARRGRTTTTTRTTPPAEIDFTRAGVLDDDDDVEGVDATTSAVRSPAAATRLKGGMASMRTLLGASLRPPFAFNTRPWRLSTPTVAFQLQRGDASEDPDPAAFGAFEKHTTGYGGRMMAKMGFTPGGGLGKNGDGVRTPVAATARAKNLGLGAEGAER
ncbi:uncharacterized protein MICPUCDRAFT_58415 [Micromonas pusilla CCMP1545]|uniref:Predicted protein n=1 Tax=Micromonas pusilla (strain CCMP1545) TaxID=564608 RepID=C1MSA9_MICPC|nr:uncharacterized protein MICPUCDRAFT_58415 [Micromonas pusilla CCMP1545]EEH57104.1 predicted protein [Micromonas pusilla CCMP1545]|eukprot:XP_003058649.1 predicted protein [Micromonas pusilla CCMP1545]